MSLIPTPRSRRFPRRLFRHALGALIVLTLAAWALPGRALAQSITFADPLTGPSSPNLSIPAGYSYTAQGLQRTSSLVYRSLVKTVSGAHLTATQFTAEVAVTLASGDIAFVGLGQGVSNPNYGPNEPTNSFVFRIHNLSGTRQIDAAVAAGTTSNQFLQTGSIGNYTAGSTTVFRIVRDGDNVTLSVPAQGFSRTFSLAAYSGAMGLTAANTHFFFGSTSTGTRFSNVSVSVPVPSSLSPLPASSVFSAVPEMSDYRVVYELNLPNTAQFNTLAVPYAQNHSALVPASGFSRIAYALELNRTSDPANTEWIWVSFDRPATITSAAKLGVPNKTAASPAGTTYHHPNGTAGDTVIANMNVFSNVAGIVTNTGIATGSIEFWPFDYSHSNAFGVPGANGGNYDFGDKNELVQDWGSMQLHNYGAAQTLFAFNNWGNTNGAAVDVGIGNQVGGSGHPDWTFARNGASYVVKRLYVLVKTSPPPPLPATSVFSAVPEVADYRVVYELNIPNTANYNTAAIPYAQDNSSLVPAAGFTRIAYALELNKTSDPANTQWVWASFDRPANITSAAKIGVPNKTAAAPSGTTYHFPNGTAGDTAIANMNVFSNVAGIVTSTGIATGSIEFWPFSYGQTNTAGVPGASAGIYDFGDNNELTNNYGSMQLHNYGAAQTLFGFNNWGATLGAGIDLGIGNQTGGSGHPDWTFAANAASYVTKRLYVLVKTPSAAPPVITSPTTAAGTYGSAFSYTIAATNSPTGYTASGLPTGLSLNAATGAITGTPTQSGVFSVALSAANAAGTGTATLALTIAKATATLVLGGLDHTYDGTVKAATATTTPAGLVVTFNYAGDQINAGSHGFVATVTDANYTGNASGTLTIAPAAGTVTLGSLSQTYNGTPRPATAVTVPAGLAVGFTYNGAATAPTAPGSYAVVGTIADPNYTGTASGTLAVAKGTATVTLGSLAPTYDGTPKAATATTVPAGLTVNFTYDGSPVPPTAAGSYAVIGTVADANYEGSAAGTLVIAKAAAGVTLGGLSQTYDGTPRLATATTSPAGLAVHFDYSGSATAPAGAGTYPVVATIADANYTGTATGTLVVAKAAATVTLADLAPTYDGALKPASATTAPAGLGVTFTYNGSPVAPTGAGTYAVVATVNDANHEGTAAGTLTIAKATATVVLGGLSHTYDGSLKAANAVTTPTGLAVVFTTTGTPIGAGSYGVTATVTDDNYAGTAAGTLVIDQAAASVVLGALAQNFNGTPRAASATTSPAGLTVTLTYDGAASAPTAVGSYQVVGTISDANYTGSDSGTLAVAKGAAAVVLGALAPTYDGSPKAATATTTPAGLAVTFTYDGSATAPTSAGSYAVVATIDDASYEGTAAGTLVIAKAAATVTLGGLAQTFDGTPRAATATTAPAGLAVNFTYNGSATAPTNAGSYTVVGTIADNNYSGTATGTLVVAKATATAVLAGLAPTYDGSPKSVTATTAPAGLGVSFTYGGSAVAPAAAGTYAVVATINDANYEGTAAGTLTIAKASATVALGGLAQSFDGAPKPAAATTVPAGLSVGLTYDGAAAVPTAAGTYAVVATINDTNYTGTASGTLVVAKGTAAVTLAGLAQTYNGTPKPVLATTSPAGLPVVVTYNGTPTPPTAPGSYAVVATVNSPNYTGSTTGTLVVAKIPVAITLGNLVRGYTGLPNPTSAITSPAGLPVTFTYNGSPVAPVNAGTYVVVATVNTPTHAGTATGTLSVAKAPATVVIRNLWQVYTGTPRTVAVTTLGAGFALPVVISYNGAEAAPVNAGTYTVVATVNHLNYAGTRTETFTVVPAPARIIVDNLTVLYTGAPRVASATTIPAGLPVNFTYNGSPVAPTLPGTYVVNATIGQPNYSASTSSRLVITRATASVSLTNVTQPYDGTPKSVAATTVPAGLPVTFTYNGSAVRPTAAGTYAVVASVNTSLYTGTGYGTFTITKAAASITFGTLAQVADGTPKAAVATTVPAGLALRFTYNGSATPPSAPATYHNVVATIVDANYAGSATGALTIVAGGPRLSAVSPNAMLAGSGGTITVSGSGGFIPTSVARLGGVALTTTYVSPNQLTAVVPPSLLPVPAQGIATLPITVLNSGVVSASVPFSIKAASVGPIQTVGAQPGQSTGAVTLPTRRGAVGLAATLTHSALASSPASLTTAVYTSNPVAGTRIDTGGGIVDLQITGADPADTATVRFYYSSAVTGAAEANLILRYFNGTTWAPIRGSGGAAPAKNTADNQDRTVSGGRFNVTFSNTSTPKITELAGTIIAMSVNEAPVAAAGPDQSVAATNGNEALVTLDARATTDADDDRETLTYEWRNGRKVLGTGATLLTSLEVGVHTLTLEVTDAAGETSTDTVKITVRDTLAPTLELPGDLIRNTKRADGRKVRYDVDVSDFTTRYRDIKLTYSHRSGSRFPVGTTTVTVTAKDEAGNTATGTFTVTVVLKAQNEDDDDNGSCDDDDDDDRDHNHRGDRDDHGRRG